MMYDFKVGGGRSLNATRSDCDTCEGIDVPCIFFPAAEDQSGSSVCEACVKRMQAAFDAYRVEGESA